MLLLLLLLFTWDRPKKKLRAYNFLVYWHKCSWIDFWFSIFTFQIGDQNNYRLKSVCNFKVTRFYLILLCKQHNWTTGTQWFPWDIYLELWEPGTQTFCNFSSPLLELVSCFVRLCRLFCFPSLWLIIIFNPLPYSLFFLFLLTILSLI